MDKKSIFDHANLESPKIPKCRVLAAGDTAQWQYERLLRHFMLLALEPSAASALAVVQPLMNAFFGQKIFSREIQGMADNLAHSTVDLYVRMLSGVAFLPGKLCCMFSLRDVINVVRGMTQSRSSTQSDTRSLVQLWVYESSRTFGDRLTCLEDKTLYRQCIKSILHQTLSLYWSDEEIFGSTNDSQPSIVSVWNSDSNTYELSSDWNYAQSSTLSQLKMCSTSLDPQIELLLPETMERIMSVVRIISQPYSHGLLVGESDTCRETLVRMVSSDEVPSMLSSTRHHLL